MLVPYTLPVNGAGGGGTAHGWGIGPAPPHVACVTLGKSFILSVPWFPACGIGIMSPFYVTRLS